MKISLMLLVAVFLSGCTTQPVTTDQAKDVPSERITNKALLEQSAVTGTVIIKRDSGSTGGICSTRVYLDGKEIALIDPAEKLVIHPQAGDHILSAEPKGLCSGKLSEVQATVLPGKILTFRVGYDSGVIFGIKPTAF